MLSTAGNDHYLICNEMVCEMFTVVMERIQYFVKSQSNEDR